MSEELMGRIIFDDLKTFAFALEKRAKWEKWEEEDFFFSIFASCRVVKASKSWILCDKAFYANFLKHNLTMNKLAKISKARY